jgi:indole-3-glycerol phosphate synthase
MILDELAAHARRRVCAAEERMPLPEVRERSLACKRPVLPFGEAIEGEGLSFICEVKKASPSKGVIDPVFDFRGIAQAYERAGADAVSCLTEPRWFLGSDEVFRSVREEVSCPLLRKDFTVSEYQVHEARCLGADAVLLICALLGTTELEHLLGVCDELGLAALVEAHDAQEVESAIVAGARIIGANNRDLHDFSVDSGRAARLREFVSPEVLFVAESGISTPEDIGRLARQGVDAVLVGEVLMRAEDKAAQLAAFRAAAAGGGA